MTRTGRGDRPKQLVVPYPDGGLPLAQVLLQARDSRSYAGVVDSGATHSAFPLELAAEIGISRDDLVRVPGGARGLGNGERAVPAWRPRYITVNAQVVADIAGGEAERFGSPFALNPWFLEESERMILGQADFFKHFKVSFAASHNRRDLILEVQ
jgi:hypothetical protein